MNTQKGFVNILLILVGLSIVGGGVYVYKTNFSQNKIKPIVDNKLQSPEIIPETSNFTEIKSEPQKLSDDLEIEELASSTTPEIKSEVKKVEADDMLNDIPDDIQAQVDEWIKASGGNWEENNQKYQTIVDDKNATVSDCYKIGPVFYDMLQSCIVSKSNDENIKNNCTVFAKGHWEERNDEDKKTIAAFEFNCIAEYFTNKSVANNNTNQCNSIKLINNIWTQDLPDVVEDEYNLCVYGVNLQQAILYKDISYCKTLNSVIKGDYYYGEFYANVIGKENCYYYVAKYNNDSSICKYIEHDNLQKTCFDRI